MSQRATFRSAVYVIPRRGDTILLMRRFNTGYADGNFSFAAGHVESGEAVTDTALREAAEETGIVITREQLEFAHVQHRFTDDGLVYFDFYFLVSEWTNEPCIVEPHRCDEIRWCAVTDLPPNTIPYIRAVVEEIFVKRAAFSEFGWAR